VHQCEEVAVLSKCDGSEKGFLLLYDRKKGSMVPKRVSDPVQSRIAKAALVRRVS
jgi:hypothetical protein